MQTKTQDPDARLLDWLEHHGARFEGCRAVAVPGMGIGLVATRDLDEEDPILIIPREVWLTRKTEHTTHRPTIDAMQERDVYSHSMSRLALLVALERDTHQSFFEPYLHRLEDPTVPYQLTEAERAATQGLPLLGWVDEQHKLTKSECEHLARELTAFGRERAPDLREWQWAYGHVMQRTFSVDIGEDEVWVMVPGVDFCNHADDPNAAFFAEEDGWHLEARRPIREGEQITIRYGRAKSSSDLLLYYGFVTPDNPNDRLHLKLELADDDPDADAKRAAVEVLGLSTDALIGPDGSIPSSFLHAAILWGLDSDSFRQDQPDVTSPELAIGALERIASSVDSALAAFPTTIAEDEAALGATSSKAWMPALVAYRLNVKRLHRAAAQGIRERIREIESAGWSPKDVVEDDPDGRYGCARVTVSVG